MCASDLLPLISYALARPQRRRRRGPPRAGRKGDRHVHRSLRQSKPRRDGTADRPSRIPALRRRGGRGRRRRGHGGRAGRGRARPRVRTRRAAAGSRSTGSASSSTPCATRSRPTRPAPSPTLADIGYTKVETAGTAGLSAAAFRALLDANGIRATSGHFGIPQPFDATAWRATLADARTLGCHYVVHPFFGVDANGPIRDVAVWRAFAQDLNTAGAIARGRASTSATTTTTSSSSRWPTAPAGAPTTS